MNKILIIIVSVITTFVFESLFIFIPHLISDFYDIEKMYWQCRGGTIAASMGQCSLFQLLHEISLQIIFLNLSFPPLWVITPLIIIMFYYIIKKIIKII